MSLALAAMHRAVADDAKAVTMPLREDSGPLALPPGFRQRVFSRTSEPMDDGLRVPGKHDGMCAMPVSSNAADARKVLLIRNHEIDPAMEVQLSAFGDTLELIDRIDRSKLYDNAFGGRPMPGGTTTLVYNLDTERVERQFLSLGGTGVNCAGGVADWRERTPTWITCEEWTKRADGAIVERDHGYCFEVPARADAGLVVARPLPALGRFLHEAVAVDAVRGIVYLTEDRGDSVLYRFLPATVGSLDAGRLQVLVAAEKPSLDTRNWPPLDANGAVLGPPVITVRAGDRFTARWIDIDGIDSPKDDLRFRAFDRGAMRFARCEGIWRGGDGIYVAATTGGPANLGQLWRYRPSEFEGTADEATRPGTIELFLESHDRTVLKNCDNLCVAPWGDLFVCEDGEGRDGIVRVRPDGTVHRFALNVLNTSELAGLCFSPDGTTLFVNIQNPGMTIAVSGPWQR